MYNRRTFATEDDKAMLKHVSDSWWDVATKCKFYYYSFKIFPRFWLVKTTRIIHHSQLLLTKYSTNDVKSAVRCKILNQWRQNDVKNAARCKLLNQWRQNDVKSAARCRLLNRWQRKPGDKVVLYLVSLKNKAKWQKSFKNWEIFWMNNKAIIELGFREIWRILQVSEGFIHLGLQPRWITPSLIHRILHILLSLNQEMLIITIFIFQALEAIDEVGDILQLKYSKQKHKK